MKIVTKTASLSLATLALLLSCQEPVITNTGGDLTRPLPSASSSEPTPSPQLTPSAPVSQLQGVVQEQGSGRPLAGVSVRLNAEEQVTDAAGFYRFSNVQPGLAKLLIISSEFVSVNRTLTLTAGSRVEDIFLTPNPPSLLVSPTPAPSATEAPAIILLPDGSTSQETPLPSPVPSASPVPSPVASETPTSEEPVPSVAPSPTSSPAYDPALDEAAQADVVIQQNTNGLLMVLQLKRANGLPIIWDGGSVFVEYFLANPDNSLLTSGRSFVVSSDDRFVVSIGSRTAAELVNVDISILLPNSKTLKIKKSVNVQN